MQLPSLGKISPEVFEKVILPQLGAKASEIIVGPQSGVDCSVLDFGDKVLVFETDPVYIAPQLGMELASWFAVHILASDVSVMGAKPKYLCIDLNLPLEMTEEQLVEMWNGIHNACKNLGVSIISGHTAKYPGCNFPMLGGATMIGIADKDKFVTPKGAKPGDKIIITKGAAIEATGLLSTFFYDKVKEKIGTIADDAKKLCWQMSVVEDAQTAMSAGGVTSMHDATECGIYGALYEVAQASNAGMRVEKEKIIVRKEAKAVCELFKIDPYISISEGTLLITAKPENAGAIIEALKKKNIEASIVGDVLEKGNGMRLVESGIERELVHPTIDPFWAACSGKALEE